MLSFAWIVLLYLSSFLVDPVCSAALLAISAQSQQSTVIGDAEPREYDSLSHRNVRAGVWELSECTDSQDVLAKSPPVDHGDHLGASDSVRILKRALVAIESAPITYMGYSTPGTTIIIDLRTPWPMILGQTIFSLAMAWLGRGPKPKPNQETGLRPNPPLYKQIAWAVNLVRSIVAAIFQLIEITKGQREMPSVGEAIVLSTVLVSSYTFETGIAAKVAGYIGAIASALGLMFYVSSGILTWVSNGLLSPCPSYGIGLPPGCTIGNSTADAVPCQSITWEAMGAGDWMYLTAWCVGAFWFGLFVLIPYGLSFFACKITQFDVSTIKWISLYVMLFGGLIACSSAACTAVFAKDPSGYWDLWVQDKVQVTKSLFTW